MRNMLLAGRYLLSEEIGRGGMGCVWLAQDSSLNRQVAIKEMFPLPHHSDAERTAMYTRVEREASYAARISHRSLITIYDVVVTEDGRPWIVMEYLELPTLHDYVSQKGRLKDTEVIKIARNLLDVLAAVHAEGIVHRDIKPGNILVRPDGTIVLLDFGIAKRLQDTALTDLGMMIGSPPFMAPECFKTGVETGPAVDLWAVGLVLYFALTGKSPFQRDSQEETWYAILHEDVPRDLLEGVLGELVDGLLNKEVAKRFTLAEARDQLQKAIAATERRTETTVRPDVAVAQPSRRRAAILTATTLLAVGSLVLAVVVDSDGDDKKTSASASPSAKPSSAGLPVPHGSPTGSTSSSPSSSPSPSVSASANLRPHLVTVKDGDRVYSDYEMSFIVPDGWKVLNSTSKQEVQLEASNGNTYDIEVIGIGDLEERTKERRSLRVLGTNGPVTYSKDSALWDSLLPTSYSGCGGLCPAGSSYVFSTQISRTDEGKLIEVTVKQNTILPKGVEDDSVARRAELTEFSERVLTH